MTLGMTKKQAIILRIGSCIFVFIGSLGMHAMSTFFHSFHIYGHALVLGIFLYMLLVDVLPIMTGEQQHNHCMDPDAEDTCQEDKQMKDGEVTTSTPNVKIGIENGNGPCNHHHHHPHPPSTLRRKFRLFLIVAITFAIVAGSIVLLPDTHSGCGKGGCSGCGGHSHTSHHSGCNHNHRRGGSHGHVHNHRQGGSHGHGHSHRQGGTHEHSGRGYPAIELLAGLNARSATQD